ncbi:hypothetical protein CDAR_198741 [Caerostris darwini]|uniref:Uncharacterized protein n=1 Tax=Caerostris darwini TaxID=1538125 RepID=A0AAV4W4B0_9ARAC|nr:hypothetical protein CDAR_198741 [Caerostris darwini]
MSTRQTHAIVLQRESGHFSGEDSFLLWLLGILHYAGAASGDITTREQPFLASRERETSEQRGGAPSSVWETRDAVDSPKCPESQAEKGRSRAINSVLGQGEQKSSRSQVWVQFRKHNAFTWRKGGMI